MQRPTARAATERKATCTKENRAKKKREFRNTVGLRAFELHEQGILGLDRLYNPAKDFRLVHSYIGQHLAVDLNITFFQVVHQP